MKRASYSLSLLLVVTGLFSSLLLSAQQYHDAAAFGLKGHVKECKVVKNEDGSSTAWDPHNFSKLSFTKDGRLEFWAEDSYNNDNRVKYISDYVRSNGLLTGFKYSVTSDDSRTYVFYYKEGQLFGYDCVYWEDDSVFGYIEDTSVSAFFFTGSDSFTNKFFGIGNNSKQVDKIIEDGFKKGVDFFPNLKAYYEEDGFLSFFYTSRSFATDYVIKERDSHGNYTILTSEQSSESIRRIITYWDDEPATAKPATAKPAQASSYSITSTAPGIKLSTSKELTLKDLISKPLGVIDNPSKSLWGIDPEKVIEYIQGNKEWKCTESYGTYSIREGFNRTFKGYPLDVDVKKYEYVNYSYGYGYYVTMGYKDQETKEAASREMEKLFNIVVKEFRDLGIELTQSQGESWVRAEKTIGDMHYLVALNKPVEIDGKVFNEDYYVSIGINKPL